MNSIYRKWGILIFSICVSLSWAQPVMAATPDKAAVDGPLNSAKIIIMHDPHTLVHALDLPFWAPTQPAMIFDITDGVRYVGYIESGDKLEYKIPPGRHILMQYIGYPGTLEYRFETDFSFMEFDAPPGDTLYATVGHTASHLWMSFLPIDASMMNQEILIQSEKLELIHNHDWYERYKKKGEQDAVFIEKKGEALAEYRKFCQDQALSLRCIKMGPGYRIPAAYRKRMQAVDAARQEDEEY